MTSEHAERRQPVEPAAGVGVILNLDTLEDGAERDPLCEGRDQGADREGGVPKLAVSSMPPAEFECDTAEDKAEEHGDHQRVGRR